MLTKLRALVADDDPDTLRTVAKAVRALGADVVVARDGSELLLKLADEGPFSVIVTDVSMPWMNGLQAMFSVRHAGVATPIVVMTGLDDARLPQEVRALGPRARLLRKPFELEELESAIAAVVDGARHDAA